MEAISCDHCKQTITHTHVQKGDYHFCCEGCEQVFFILKNENSETYYQLCDLESSQPPKASISQSYKDYLSEMAQEDNLKQMGNWEGCEHDVTLYSAEMHCSACSWLIEKRLLQFDGIIFYELHFAEGSLRLKYSAEKIQLVEILQQLAKFGYAFKGSAAAVKMGTSEGLLIRIALSAAVFANVMIFSIANYLGFYQGILLEWQSYFAYASLILNLPVVTYGAFPFYQKAWVGLKHGVLHMDLPISLGILINFSLSVYQVIEGKEGFFDGLAGIVFFLLSGRWLVKHFEHRLLPDPNWFENLFAQQIRKKKTDEEGWIWINPEKVVCGEILKVRPGEYLPVKGKLLSERGVFDPQLLTGETRLLKRQLDENLEAGLQVVEAEVVVQSEEDWLQSDLAKLRNQWDHLQKMQSKKESAEKIVPYFTGSLFVIAMSFFFTEPSLSVAFEKVGVLFILSCPCALALARPLSLGLALKKAREMGFLIRSEEVLEKLARVRRIFFDKTGTLTFSQKKLKRWYGKGLSSIEKSILSGLCQGSIHPVSLSTYKEIGEQSEAKFLEKEEKLHWGLWGRCQVQGQNFEVAFGRLMQRPEELRLESPPSDLEGMQNGLWINGAFRAALAFNDEIREGVKESLQSLQQRGVVVQLLSGDEQGRVDKFLAEVESGVKGYGGLSPQEKVDILLKYQRQEQVMAVGDGLNDSLLLNNADLGMLAEGGFRALSTGVDILSIKTDWTGFENLFDLAKISKRSIRWSYTVSLIYNAIALYFAFVGHLAPLVAAIAMPISSLSVCMVVAFTFWSQRRQSLNW